MLSLYSAIDNSMSNVLHMIPLKLSQLVHPPRQHNLTLCGAARRRRSQASGPTSACALLWRYSNQHVCLEHRHSNGEYEEEGEVGGEGATKAKIFAISI